MNLNSQLKSELDAEQQKQRALTENSKETLRRTSELRRQEQELRARLEELDGRIRAAEENVDNIPMAETEMDALNMDNQAEPEMRMSPPPISATMQQEDEQFQAESPPKQSENASPVVPREGLEVPSPEVGYPGSYKASPAATAPNVSPSPGMSPPVIMSQTQIIERPVENPAEIRYKACLTTTNAVWHEDGLVRIRLARSVNVPMRSAAYKVTFENKQNEATLHVQRFDMVAYDVKGTLGE